jgi:iron-sulfur cluster repair protein YtfE (RIC family)
MVNDMIDQRGAANACRRPQLQGEAFMALLERDQRRLLRLCIALEKIADGLPASGQRCGTARILPFLDQAFTMHVLIHDKCLFPMVRSLAETSDGVELILRQLEFEHASDHGLIVEICSVFAGEACNKGGVETQILGYLLRAFFENYRRHCAWESNVLYPIARKFLVTEPHWNNAMHFCAFQ